MSKLYVLMDEKLSSGQKLAQSCHAVAEHVAKRPHLWDNDTIVILDAPRYFIQYAIQGGAIGFQDSYYKEPRAAAFTGIPALENEIKEFSLAK